MRLEHIYHFDHFAKKGSQNILRLLKSLLIKFPELFFIRFIRFSRGTNSLKRLKIFCGWVSSKRMFTKREGRLHTTVEHTKIIENITMKRCYILTELGGTKVLEEEVEVPKQGVCLCVFVSG